MSSSEREAPSGDTPAAALRLLQQGNERFRRGAERERDSLRRVRETSGGQRPFAAILGCIDSRVPPELVFDQGIGDVFGVRIAGNVVNEDVLGSLEFACKVAGARLVLVLGHRHCGAIQGACDGLRHGHLTALLARLQTAVHAVREPADPARRTSHDRDFVQAVARANVLLAVEELVTRSSTLRNLRAAGAIDVVGAMYDVESGAVEFLGA